jgi:hypothetical protein
MIWGWSLDLDAVKTQAALSLAELAAGRSSWQHQAGAFSGSA